MTLAIAAFRQAGETLIDENFDKNANIQRAKLSTRTLLLPLSANAGKASGSNSVGQDASFGFVVFGDAGNTSLHFTLALPDNYIAGNAINFQWHWNAVPITGDAVFELDLTSAEAGEETTADVQDGKAVTVAGTTLQLTKSSFTVAAATFKAGDILGIELRRTPASAGDTLGADLNVFAVALTYDARG